MSTPILHQAESILSSIAGLGTYLPEAVVSNQHFASTLDTSHEWIVERTGIHERRCVAAGEATSDLAFRAATAALEDAKVSASELDLILLATSTADSPIPATACHLQARLQAANAAAMDVVAGCAGFGYGLHMASGLVRAGLHRRVLVVGADCLSRIVNYADRQSCILFGDGAGAAVVGASGILDVVYSSVGADGTASDLICVRAGGSRVPASQETVATAQHTVELRGREVFKAAVRQMSICLRQAADALGVRAEDFDLVIPHQANARIIEAIGTQMEIDPQRLVIDVAGTGNTAAASIPLALARARTAGRIQPGNRVAIVGFGAGAAWACQVLESRERS